MTLPLRVGAVNYLNTKPLIEGLAESSSDIALSLDLPSRLADQLAAIELDIALIPVIEYFRAGTYSVIPNIAIAARGPVLSVTLFSRVPWPEIRSVAMDEGSRTSAGLAQVLLRKRYHIKPRVKQLPIDQHAEQVNTDAVLLIGDRAMKECLPGFAYAFDLSQAWNEWTGLPFVFAIWAVREGVDLGSVQCRFEEAKQRGLQRAGVIAAREAPQLGLDPGFCRRYLTDILHYDLGPSEQAGMNRFRELASEVGLIPELNAVGR